MMNSNSLDHDTRNALLGMKLELRRIVDAIVRLEQHVKRIDEAVKTCGDSHEARTTSS